jgi:hypothetical protein
MPSKKNELPSGKNRSKLAIKNLKSSLTSSVEGNKLLEDFESDELILLMNKDSIVEAGERRGELFIMEITNVVLDQLLCGKSRREIHDKLVSDYKFKTFKQVKRFIEKAYIDLKAMMQEDRVHIKDRHQGLLMELYKMNLNNGDLREARTCLEVLNKMFGLNEASKIELNGNLIQFKYNTGDVKEISSTETPFEEVKDNDEEEDFGPEDE